MAGMDLPEVEGKGALPSRHTQVFAPKFRDYVSLLGARRWFIIVFSGAAAVTALALTYVVSERYEAEAMLFYRPQEVTRFAGKAVQAFGSPVPQAPFKVISRTMEEVLTSEAILRPTVEILSLDHEPKTYEGAWYVAMYRRAKDWAFEVAGKAWSLLKFGRIIEPDPTEKAIARLRSHTRLRNRDSYVFELRVRHKRPELAAAIANEIASRMVDWLNQQDAAPSEQRIERISRLIATKEHEISKLRQAKEEMLERERVASVSLEADRATTRLHDLTQERLRTDAEITKIRAEIESVRGRQIEVQDIERISNGRLVDAISPEVAHRIVSNKQLSEIQLNGLIAKRNTLSTQIADLEKHVTLLPTLQSEVDRVTQQLEVASLDLLQLRTDLQEAKLRQSSARGELRLLSEARIPLDPVSPIKIYHTGLALSLALVLSIGLTIAFTLLNIRIFFPSKGPRARNTVATTVAGEQR